MKKMNLRKVVDEQKQVFAEAYTAKTTVQSVVLMVPEQYNATDVHQPIFFDVMK